MNNKKLQKKPIIWNTYEALLGLEDTMPKDIEESTKQSSFSIREIRLDELKEFPNHPFKVKDDNKMTELAESILEYGVLHPGLALESPDGGYIIVSGHRRARACRLVGKDTMPFRVIEEDMDTARIMMVDSNFQQRDELLPSEKALAYRMKYDAIKRQGRRGVGNSLDELGGVAGESGKTVQRFLRLSYLSDDLLALLDQGRLGIVQGVNISFLDVEKQNMVSEAIIQTGVSMSKEQALKIKENAAHLSMNLVKEILLNRKPKKRVFSLKSDKLSQYFSDDVGEDEIEQLIFDLLDKWKQGR